MRCEKDTMDEILTELLKRSYLPIYIPLLLLISCNLLLISRDQHNYNLKKILIFIIGFFLIAISEVLIRYSAEKTLLFIMLPIILFLITYYFLTYKLKKNI